MAIIEGQIEPLKKLKEILHQNGITRFGSIGEINDFIKSYETEKNEIAKVIENELDNEINQLQIDITEHQLHYDNLKSDVTNEINIEIENLQEELELIRKKSDKSSIRKIFLFPKAKILENKKAKLQNNSENIIGKRTHRSAQDVSRLRRTLDDYTINREKVVSERCLPASQELDRTKEIIDGLYNLIAGAVGENAVIKEVQKLSDNFHLFNDFAMEFNPPVYNKKEDDRIFSIQIDHLLVCEAGIFILETKNWSKQSVKSIDLRSPVKQILRSSYALFVLLNSQSTHDSINLECHHWGRKQIPVRNLIVMTNAKPREEFKHVKVLSLKELNGYITYFDPVFSSAEIENICSYLRMNKV